MDSLLILQPMFAMFALTFAVWMYMYAKRIPFIQNSQLTPEQLEPLEFTRLSPPDVANPSDNLKNLFELPVLFYAFVLTLYSTETVDAIHIACAWGFVALRVLHSIVHCTVNVVMLRFVLYALASLALWVMIARAALQLFI